MSSLKKMITAAFLALGAVWLAPTLADAQELKQVKLSAAQIEAFIAAQKDLAELNKTAESQPNPSDKPDPKIQAEYEAIAKKHKFGSFAELDDIGANISLVYAGIDPQSGQFLDPQDMIKKEMDDITADKQIPEKDKKQMLDELTEALKTTPALQFKENIELVKQYREKLEAVMQ